MTTFFPRFAAGGLTLLCAALLIPASVLAQGIYPLPEAAPGLSLRVTGTVEAIVPFDIDGVAGVDGYAIGGNFDQINGAARRNLALVDADGALLDWSPDANATVRALAVSGDALLVGGDFTSVGGLSRSYLASVSLADGSVSGAFAPVLDGAVRALAVDAANAQVFAGGVFGVAGGSARDATAKFNLADGTLVAGWTPGYVDAGQVNALAYDAANAHLYVGGTLKMRTGGGGHDRAIGRLDGGTGARDTGWSVAMHPRGGAQVWSIALDGANDRVYLGGQFRRIRNNSSISNLVRVSRSTAALDTGWNPATDGIVRVIALDGADVLVGGDFSQVGGVSRQRFARVDASGSTVAAFSADADRPVRTIALAGTQAVIGGAFRFLGGDGEEGLARVDAATGARDAAFTGVAGGPGQVKAFAFDAAGGVVAGGEFDFVQQAGDATTYARSNMLRLNADFSLDTAWTANVSGDVQALAISGSTLYLAGSFLQVTDPMLGTPAVRLRLAAYDLSAATPALGGWAPSADGDVSALVVDAAGIYVGGLFLNAGGAARAFAARLDAASGLAHAWDVAVDGPVHSFLASGTDVFLGGDFSTAGGATRANLALVDNTAGTASATFAADTDAAVHALALDGTHLYIGGGFGLLQAQVRSGAGRIDLGTGTVDSWNPSVAGVVQALAFDGIGWAHLGGSFASAGGVAHPNLARASMADAAGGVDPSWRPGSDGPVAQIAGVSGGDVLVGGEFAAVTNLARGGLALLGPDGSDLTAVTIDSIAPSPSIAGQSWTVSYTVSNTTDAAVIPTGSVVVSTDAGESCAAAAIDAAGQGSCTITSNSAGARVVTVSYTADAPELMDSQATAAHMVNAGAVSVDHLETMIAATDASATADGVDTGAVRVSLVDSLGNPVVGVAVSLSAAGASLATANGSTDAAGQFASTLTSVVAGTVGVTAQFDADGDGTVETAVVNGSPAEVVFSAGAVDAGSAATLIAVLDASAVADGVDTAAVQVTLSDAQGNGVPGVAVSFASSGSAALSTAGVTDATGQATATLTDTVIETVDVTAMFDADNDGTTDTAVANGSPAQVSFVAQTFPTTTAITAHEPVATVVGESYLVSFQVTASAAPTGVVLVSDGAGGSCNATLDSGDAGAGSCTLSSTSVGDLTLTANFSGSGSFEDSVSTGVTHNVAQAATTLSVTPSASIVIEGDSVTFSWSVAVDAPGAGTPGGSVSVSEAGGLGCTAAVSAGSCQVTLPNAGNYVFSGTYGGDASFLGDTSAAMAIDVQSGVVTPPADVVVRHEIVRSGILSDGSGDLVDYELEVSNSGGLDANAVDVDMLMPAEFTDIAWTCSATGGGSCGTAAGNGDVMLAASLPAGSSILVELSVRVVDPEDRGVATAAFASTATAESDTGNNSATTFYRSCSSSELLVVGGFTTLPAHVCGFRDGFEGGVATD